MTNHWIDYKNADVFFIIGANPAENHPIAMKWILRAKEERGAKVIVVDPRYTRTCISADYFGEIRPGTDIAFLNGLINYAIQNGLYHKEYVLSYTNASYIVSDEYYFEDGEFSGLKEINEEEEYDTSSWDYKYGPDGKPLRDETLQDPRCVFQVLKKHVERYDIDKVSQVTGCDKETYEEIAKVFCSTGQPKKAGNLIYAMGVTQHTVGTQNVRAIAMLQLLLGNVGIAGGGVNAQRGECNVQGSTDLAMLFHLIPGYMGVPKDYKHPTLEDYFKEETPAGGYWENTPKFLTSLLRAFYGENAVPENDFCYDLLPKCDDQDHSHQSIIEDTYNEIIKGMVIWGQNPIVGGPNQNYSIEAFKKLDWLVAIDLFETETASFWNAPGVNPEEVDTEVFLLPAASVYEKEGTVTNSGRWIQWRYQAIDPIGECKSDLWIVDRIFNGVKKLYEAEGGANPDQITKMNWEYGGGFEGYPDGKKVALEINGYNVATGKGITTFADLKDDGTTACGCWIYAGYHADPDNPACKRRDLESPEGLGLHQNFSYAWPVNRRILYNRCSADPNGKPWDKNRALFAYQNGEWKAKDVPDFNASLEPRESAKTPFIMTVNGLGRLFSVTCCGPLPEHYEPVESPVENAFNKRAYMPVANVWDAAEGDLVKKRDPSYPIIASTVRLTEHYQSGAMSRNLPALVELVPEMFVEISQELADERGIKPGDTVSIETPRAAIEVKAMVTPRLKPLKILNKEYHVITMPWHWGYRGLSVGASANALVPNVGDPSTAIPESKAFMCNIRKL